MNLCFVTTVSQYYQNSLMSERPGIESSDAMEYCEALKFLSKFNLTHGFIEIGSAWGGSFHLWASIISGIKISIDLPSNLNCGISPWPPVVTEDTMKQRGNIWSSWFEDVFSVIGSSCNEDTINQTKNILDGKKVDFLYIDADHSYDAVLRDYNNYKQFVRQDGWIGFHDIHLSSSPYNLVQLWEEIREGKKSYVFSGKEEKIGIIQV